MIVEADEVLLVWKHPRTRKRYIIGHLWRDRHGFRFGYEQEAPDSVHAAIEAGFRPLAAFPLEEGRQWQSKSLFPIFQRRLPPEWRQGEFTALGLASEDVLGYFRQTGGRLATDTLEFLEPLRENEPGGEYVVEFPIAGWRYYRGEEALSDLKPGSALVLQLERENKHDPSAVQVLSDRRYLLGYVPRVYAYYLDEAVERGDYRAEVKRIGAPDDPGLRVIVHLRVPSRLVGYRAVPGGLAVLCG